MGIDIEVSEHGPLFDGRAAVLAAEGAEAVRRELASDGERIVEQTFAGMIREDRGVFLSMTTSIDVSHVFEGGGSAGGRTYTMPVIVTDPADETVVTTEDATYGPWLEGTGSRNDTTRFKGYHGFRIAAQALEAEAGTTAETVLEPYVAAMSA